MIALSDSKFNDGILYEPKQVPRSNSSFNRYGINAAVEMIKRNLLTGSSCHGGSCHGTGRLTVALIKCSIDKY